MPVLKICLHCKKEFSVSPRRSDEVKYCSRDCKAEAGYVKYKCASCGTAFQRKRSDNAESQTRFCSRACFYEGQRGKAKPAKPDAPRYYATCEMCATQFRITKTRVGKARWCSVKCRSASPDWRNTCSTSQQAEKSWRWAGGKYQTKPGYVREKGNVNGKQWYRFEHQRVVLEFMLLLCPEHPFVVYKDGQPRLHPQIEVHHIDRDRANNDIRNLLAVTGDAHAQIHHRNRRPQPWECWPPNPTRW